ncbi:MAG: bifunctional amidotransferase subunit GatB/aspartate--tRNA ligase AspS [Ignavibacteriales bacterium]|nr:bifunctional amidotransferase subunit GatB/aspartate--tRNA ligase AspS [Ignavibacteriales bacterium]MCF8316033.1 bifunctional amidotransferase subunit GatB/aspartate--tRNA ligase AspS [Ignavibacteriales bacterium]MCF8437627.1 bifunctional amidotransferase subunit GatB/aspartate--tRNA ligase AspS [Ignavibacteriales bacterium]
MKAEKLNELLEQHDLEIVIGLETHIRLNTNSKLFCSCENKEAEVPNSNICPICTGQMGALPSLNKEAVSKAIIFGKVIGSSFVNKLIHWDRKHYEYPDLPKNYQLTQHKKPIISDGLIKCYRNDGTIFTVNIEQVHIEEDAAKLIHDGEITLVDFNKSGVPLIEVVTQPCIHNITDIPYYAQTLQRIVQIYNISAANLEKGEYKSDVSVSLRKRGANELNPRVEIKNLNSFRFMTDAVHTEVVKQIDFFIKNNSFNGEMTTVLFEPTSKNTKTMRKKEFAADYRFAKEPDIPSIDISDAILEIDIDYEVFPFNIETVLIDQGIRPQDAKYFTSDIKRAIVFTEINRRLNNPKLVAKNLFNLIKSEDYEKIINIIPFSVVLDLFFKDKISHNKLKQIIENLLKNNDFDFQTFLDTNQVDFSKVDQIINKILFDYNEIVTQINSGELNKISFLVSAVLKITGKEISGKYIKNKIQELIISGEAPLHNSEKHHKSSNLAAFDNKRTLSFEENIIVKEKYRTHLVTDISLLNIGDTVTLAGWISSIRDHGEIVFVDLRDSSFEIFQIRLTKSNIVNIDYYSKIPVESVVSVHGKVIKRKSDDVNSKIRSGELELDATAFEILNLSKQIPFEIRRSTKIKEDSRLIYKFLDHRNSEIRHIIINRHLVIQFIRNYLSKLGFIEIETPILSAGTEEGAKEFIVPARKFVGAYYALPQSPQQYKQMLICSGYDKYFQIARCFRDEDSRGDRQPEFTQFDLEMAFASMQDIISLNTTLFNDLVSSVYGTKWKLFPFKVITYEEAILKYGTDRPDLRYGLEMDDITEIVMKTNFKVFTDSIRLGGIVKCLKIDKGSKKNDLTRTQIENLTEIAKQNGLGGLAYIILNNGELQSPIKKYLGERACDEIINKMKAVDGDILFFSAAMPKIANKALDAVRQELGKILGLVKHKELHPAWIVDFPQFEKTDEGKWTFSHNPFSMPRIEYLNDHLNATNIENIIAQQYDLVVNGHEIGGGSVRSHKREILEATYKIMGYDSLKIQKSIGHMLNAFQYGTPPHGGIAWGIDRLMMVLESKSSIREVIAFPKTGSGEDLLFGSPSKKNQK